MQVNKNPTGLCTFVIATLKQAAPNGAMLLDYSSCARLSGDEWYCSIHKEAMEQYERRPRWRLR